MRTLIVLMALAIVVFSVRPTLALNADFAVSGDLGLAPTTLGCTTHTYTAICPAGHSCSCYKLTKASLHTANFPFGIQIPPGTTKAFFALDKADRTGSAGTCRPLYGEVDYTAASGPDAVQIFVFGVMCNPFFAGGPFSLSGGGAIESATLATPIGLLSPTGFGTATGTYLPGSTGQSFTLDLTANVTP
jgi:hypothetical protein